MAKIREALRRAETRRKPAPETAAGLRPYLPEDAPGHPEIEEEIPFIEVGGRATPIEASASVLASVPKTLLWKPSPEPAGKDVLSQRSETALPAGGIAFRRFPPEPAPLRPVAERFAPELVTLHQPDHPLSEQYRSLVQDLEKGAPAGPSRTLLFLAPLPQVDASAVLLNLAITCARSGTIRTLVVDANLHAPSLAECLGLPAAPGLSEVLAGKQSLARAIQETGQPNLYALTAGRTAPERSSLFFAESMRTLLHQLRTRFDWIFVNAAYAGGKADLFALGLVCDEVYLVLPEAESGTEAVEELSQRLVQQGNSLRGYFLL